MSYIIEHSGAKLILVDSEFVHLIEGTTVPTVISNDTGREDDPYEAFLGKPHAVPGCAIFINRFCHAQQVDEGLAVKGVGMDWTW